MRRLRTKLLTCTHRTRKTPSQDLQRKLAQHIVYPEIKFLSNLILIFLPALLHHLILQTVCIFCFCLALLSPQTHFEFSFGFTSGALDWLSRHNQHQKPRAPLVKEKILGTESLNSDQKVTA